MKKLLCRHEWTYIKENHDDDIICSSEIYNGNTIHTVYKDEIRAYLENGEDMMIEPDAQSISNNELFHIFKYEASV